MICCMDGRWSSPDGRALLPAIDAVAFPVAGAAQGAAVDLIKADNGTDFSEPLDPEEEGGAFTALGVGTEEEV